MNDRGDDVKIPTLVVEDQADVRMLMCVLIDHANDGLFVIGEAANGPEALDRIDATDPAVVVLDEMMPEMNGLETAERIRARRPHQVMVLCSAHLDAEMLRRARAVGVLYCLHKDDVHLLPDVIRSAMGGSRTAA